MPYIGSQPADLPGNLAQKVIQIRSTLRKLVKVFLLRTTVGLTRTLPQIQHLRSTTSSLMMVERSRSRRDFSNNN